MHFGIYITFGGNAVGPFVNGQAGATLIIGTQGGNIVGIGSAGATASIAGVGGSLGRGISFGAFTGDVSAFQNPLAFSVDTMMGGATGFFGEDGLLGLGWNGESLGVSLSMSHPDIPTVGKTFEKELFNLNPNELICH